MKKSLTKNKFILQVIFGFLFSLLVFSNVLLKNNKIDKIIASNMKLSVLLFVIIVFASLFTNIVLDLMKNAVLTKPNLLVEVLKILNYQVFLFTLLYFFMDTIFRNAYIDIPFFKIKTNPIVYVGIILIFSIFYKIKNKDCTTKQWFITVSISSIIIFNISYMEIFFLLIYIFIFSIMKKRIHLISKLLESNISYKNKLFANILSVVILMLLSAIFSRNIFIFMISLIILAVVFFIVYHSKEVYLLSINLSS